MRTQRMYGLYEKVGSRWQRLYPNLAYPKRQAVRVFQDALLAYSLGAVPNERRLRPLPTVADFPCE